MKRLYTFVVTCLFFVSCTCASTASEDPSGATNVNPSSETGTASIIGTIWMPANNPTALSNASHAIPVFDALIDISSTQPVLLERGVSCTECFLPSQNHALSNHDGTFSLNGIAGGDYWVTITKSGFRRSFEITIADDELIALDETQTTLPSFHDPEQGAEIPSIALVTGTYDLLEDMLGKMGMGQLSVGGQFIWGSEQGIFDVYDGYTSSGNVSVEYLLLDIELMSQYQVILFPCSSGRIFGGSLAVYPPIVWQNIRDYISRGGKMFVTDWSGEYVDNIFS